MKIGFVIDDGLDKPDGVQQYILTLGRWYIQEGHEVRYLAGQTNRKDIEGLYSIPKNIKVRFNGNALSIPLPASSSKIKKILNDENFDVLHVQTPYSPVFGAKVVRQSHSSTAVVGTFHILPFNILTRIGNHLLGIWLRRSLKRFDAFVSVSPPAAKFAQSTFKITGEVVPNSIPIKLFRPEKPAERQGKNLKLLFLGRLVERKGCQQLLKAVALMHQKNQLPGGLRLDICGDGPMRAELESYVLRHDLTEVVNFHGFVSQRQKIEFMQQSDIAVFPSMSGESFGIVLIEAMAAGSGLILGGDNPGYRSVLEGVDGSIINVRQPEILASQLSEFINNPEKRAKLHELQQAHVQQFDTTLVGARLLHIYESCKTAASSR